MSWRVRTPLALLLLALTIPGPAAGQAGPPGPGVRRIFDPATVRTVEGEVVAVRRVPRGRRYEGVHLMVATGEGEFDVHLGPDAYVERRLPNLAKGDRVEVKASLVTLDGKPTLIAQEIRRGDTRVVLRTDAGVPLWSRAGRR